MQKVSSIIETPYEQHVKSDIDFSRQTNVIIYRINAY